ncbi:MAG TPA: response regulator [Planctomycetota bacterium]|nr:response regulator [Planctomycetota bacterium]
MTNLTGVVLVCDDNEDTLEYLEVLLRRAGHVVYTATGHGDLMPLINSVRPDLLLCDIYLPGRNGFQIAEQLRAQGEHIPIVFMTAFDTSLYRAYAQQVEHAPCITKPFDGDKLLRQIESTLQTHVQEHAFVA